MKKVISILLTLTITILLLTSCTGKISINDSKYYTDFDGVYITIDAVEVEGNKQKLATTWHNETEYPVVFGYAYDIQYSVNGEWERVIKKDFGIIEIACVIDPKGTADMTYNTEYFDLSRAGTYRLIVDFYVQTGSELNNHGNTYAEFAVIK